MFYVSVKMRRKMPFRISDVLRDSEERQNKDDPNVPHFFGAKRSEGFEALKFECDDVVTNSDYL